MGGGDELSLTSPVGMSRLDTMGGGRAVFSQSCGNVTVRYIGGGGTSCL